MMINVVLKGYLVIPYVEFLLMVHTEGISIAISTFKRGPRQQPIAWEPTIDIDDGGRKLKEPFKKNGS